MSHDHTLKYGGICIDVSLHIYECLSIPNAMCLELIMLRLSYDNSSDISRNVCIGSSG